MRSARLWAAGKLRLVVTSQCNIACFYCHNEGQAKGTEYLGEPLFHRVEELLTVDDLGPTSVTISGGEPLLHPRVVEYVGRLRSLVPEVTLVTNGLLLSGDRLKALRGAGLGKVRLGLDSLQRSKSRPSSGGAGRIRIVDVVELVLESGLQLEVNTVVTRFNANEISSIVDYCRARSISLKLFEHVEVRSFGGDTASGEMMARPVVPFSAVCDAVRKVGPGLSEGPASAFGEANYRFYDDRFEVRYCKYLCPYRLCYLTGTRIDAAGYVFTCMSQRGGHRLDPNEMLEQSRRKIVSAVQKGCGRRAV